MERLFVQLEAFYKLGREMRKGLGYTTVDNDNGDSRVENFCTSYADKQKRAINEMGSEIYWIIQMSPVTYMYSSLPDIGYRGVIFKCKINQDPSNS